ncbi:MAG: ferredoxin family protein [Promethearchaeota archaeon]
MTTPNLLKKIQELSSITYKASTILSKCKSCGTCIKYCPLDIREFNENGKAITVVSNYVCGGCSVCYHRCPNNAIKLIIIENKKKAKNSNRVI